MSDVFALMVLSKMRREQHDERIRTLEAQNADALAEAMRLRRLADNVNEWLTAALNCERWLWDSDQRDAATQDRDALAAALRAAAIRALKEPTSE